MPPGGFWLLVVCLTFGMVVMLLFNGLPSGSTLPAYAPPRPVVVVSTPYWNIDPGTSAALAHRSDVNEVSPWMYGLDANGGIVTLYAAGQNASVSSDLDRLRSSGLRVVPTLANVVGDDFSYQPIASILHDPQRTAEHVAAIVALVQRNDYAGIDIDYEDLQGSDRQAFTAFITQLSTALHAHGRTLSVALFAKTTNAGYDQRNLAQDYAAIGKVADEVRLMAYDYHWASSPPGPVAPLTWIRDVLTYAKTQIPAHKIVLGIPMYGYDWSNGQGTAVGWLQAFRLASQHKAKLQYDMASQTPWFTYTDATGHEHVVWFENAASATAKLDAAQGAGIGGVYLWLYGYEDTGVWSAFHDTFPIGSGD